jgi:C4-dicarboxylate-specific signal transduction histidine kinase
MKDKPIDRLCRKAGQYLVAGVALAVLTFVAFRLHASTATAALLYFFFIVLTSLWLRLVTSIVLCILAVLCFNYFFAPPIFSLRINQPVDVVAMIGFLVTSLVVTQLTSRVRDRTAALEKTNEQLRAEIIERKRAEESYSKTQSELAHVTRVMTMGELAASIAHEVNQPLSGVVINGNTCLRWLAANPANVEEAQEAARRIVRDGKRAGDVIARIRALATKSSSTKERMNMNEAIQDVVGLARDEVRRKGVKLRTELARDLSPVMGDRVQLQQVLLNLIMNGVDAMSTVGERDRQLVIKTQRDESDQVRVAVQDSGIGLDQEIMQKIFDAFYSTKPGGMGMGLSISRSIVQNHGGRLWAAANDGPGTTFQFTVPTHQ